MRPSCIPTRDDIRSVSRPKWLRHLGKRTGRARMRRLGLTGLVGACLAGLVLALGAVSAKAQGEHGIGFSKGCDTPTAVGDHYVCSFTIRNNSDDLGDDLTATS